ncbi:MAG: ExeM/NucH family extracellular endonuclease [Chloroflexota bacterium]
MLTSLKILLFILLAISVTACAARQVDDTLSIEPSEPPAILTTEVQPTPIQPKPIQPVPQGPLLREGFDDCTLEGWQIISADVDQNNGWGCDANYSNTQANAYNDGAPADEWLILPPFNMDAQENEQLTFRSQTGYTDDDVAYPQLSVKYSTDYDGNGDPSTATWTVLEGITFSPEDSNEWTNSGEIDLSAIAGNNVYIAFHYTSSGTEAGSAARWRVDAIEVDMVVTTPQAPFACENITLIHDVQSNGMSSPMVDMDVTVQSVVVGDFQGRKAMRGFFLQEEGADVDGDETTSEGIFVLDGSASQQDVNVGDIVCLHGTVREENQLTHITDLTGIEVVGTDNAIPAPAQVTLPEATNGDLERVEAMLVQITDDSNMVVAQNYFLGRYGQLTLAAGQRIYQPTNQALPGSKAAKDLVDDNAKRLLILDDGQDIRALGDNPVPVPYMGTTPPGVIRAGDHVRNLIGILDQGRINSSSTPLLDYRLHPTESPVFTANNMRTETPADVGGTLKVAAFNVLNYFTTIDNDRDICGPQARMGCRGADSRSEFARQKDKIIMALLAMDADVVGLVELENHAFAAPANDGRDPVLSDIIKALNAKTTHPYAFIDAGTIGTDAIKVAFIYRPESVTPVGDFQILDSSVDVAYVDTQSRPTLAQTFAQNSNDERVTIAVSHLKSKGSSCVDLGDPTDANGQGNCNRTRTDATTALAAWLATDPTGSGDADFLILGDLNAYAMEDPITALKEAGYTDLINQFAGDTAYSYTFDGMLGYLDHALGSPSLVAQVTDVTVWHINTDEPAVIGYDENYNPQGYYNVDVFRSSDHDPVIVGLDLGAK